MNEAHYNRQQANGMIGHILALIALNRECGRGNDDLATWQIQLLEQHGYYAEQQREQDFSIDRFGEEFARGRSLIYDNVELLRSESEVTVRTELWFLRELPEVFFYFDTSPEEFSEFVCALATAHARASGFSLQIQHVDGFEIARIKHERPSLKEPGPC